MIEWICTRCEYAIGDSKLPAGQVQATAMLWIVSGTEGEFSARTSGQVSVREQNRVYTLAALEAVPMNVLVSWMHDAMGEEQVAAMEANIEAQIAEQKTPTSGGFIPDGDGVETLPA